MKFLLTLVFCSTLALSMAQGPYASAAGQPGSNAIHMDSSLIVDWASVCTVNRGWVNMADTSLGKVTVGEDHFATGKSNLYGVVSLGDGGEAVIRFNGLLFDGIGPDFAIFENSFSDNFLELAFVEASSDGKNFYRFPSHSLSDTTQQVGSFGFTEAIMIHNFAGKYRWGFGTPFDLADLANIPGLDIQRISHLRVIDVVGSIDSAYVNRDSQGRPINDPFPTPFPSGGFDLDGVAAIHINSVGLSEDILASRLRIFPNPTDDIVNIEANALHLEEFQLYNYQGKLIQRGAFNGKIDLSALDSGVYLLSFSSEQQLITKRIVKR